jgi:catalase
VSLLLSEAFRHGKAIGAWAGGDAALEAVGIPVDAPGIVVGHNGTSVLEQLQELMSKHRAWERFITTA